MHEINNFIDVENKSEEMFNNERKKQSIDKNRKRMLQIRPKHKFMIDQKLIYWSRKTKAVFLAKNEYFHVYFGSDKFTFRVTGLADKKNAGIEPVLNAGEYGSTKMKTNEVIIVTDKKGNIFYHNVRIVKMNKKKLAIVNATKIMEFDLLQNLSALGKANYPGDNLQLAMESLNSDSKKAPLYDERFSRKLYLLPGVGFYLKR